MESIESKFSMTIKEILCSDNICFGENERIFDTIIYMTLRCKVDDIRWGIFFVYFLNLISVSDISLFKKIIRSVSCLLRYIFKLSCIGQSIQIDKINFWMKKYVFVQKV